MSETAPNLAGMYIGNRRYRVEYKLGQGGMGAVWLATDENLQEQVALKLLPGEIQFDPVALDDMRRETARSRRLSHPNIVRIHDLHEFPGEQPFISMEYIEGAALNSFKTQQQSRCLPWEFVETLLGQLCAALNYAHCENLIHRDLKPGNLMLDTRGRLKLADFGISAVVSDSMSRASLQGNTSGTPAYMSPQQMDGRTPRVTDDIYALGATLYDLLTGKPPFFRGDIVHQVRNLEAPTIEERLDEFGLKNPIPPAVSAMIMACLAKDPDKRPQSAAAVAEWADLHLNSEPSHSTLAQQVFAAEIAESPSSRDLTVLTSAESAFASAGTLPDTDVESAITAPPAETEAIATSPRAAHSRSGIMIAITVAIVLGVIILLATNKRSNNQRAVGPADDGNGAPLAEAPSVPPFAGPWLTESAFTVESGRPPGMFRMHPVDSLKNCTIVNLQRKSTDGPITRTVMPWKPDDQVWSIEDGIIAAHLRSDSPGATKTYLVFNGLDLGNFILTFAFRETREDATTGNFGVFYRCRQLEGWWMHGLAMVLGQNSGMLWGVPDGSYQEETREMSTTGLKRPMRDFLSQTARLRLPRHGGHLGTLRIADLETLHIVDQEIGHNYTINDGASIPESGTIAIEAWIEGPGELKVEFEGLAFRTGFGPRGLLF